MLTIEFLFTEETAIDSTVEVTKAVSPSSRMLPALGLFFVLMAFWLMQQSAAFSVGFGPLIVGSLMLSAPLITRFVIIRRAKSFPSIGQTIKWTFDDEKLVSETVGERSEFVWNKLIRVRESKKGFLLFPQPRLAYWIPRTAFKSQVEIDMFKEFVKNHSIPLKSE